MAAPALRCWSVVGLVKRWRRLFWLSPLVGLVVHLAFFHRTDIRSTVCRAFTEVGAKGGEISQEILERTSAELDLPGKWHVPQDTAIARLRAGIRFSPENEHYMTGVSFMEYEPRTAVAISLSIGEGLFEEGRRFYDARSEEETRREHAKELGYLDVEITGLRQEIAETHPTDPAAAPRDSGQYLNARLGLEQCLARRAEMEKGRGFTEPIICTGEPLVDRKTASFSQAYVPASKRAGLGFAIGVFAAPLLACLLESIFPKKRRSDQTCGRVP